MKLVVFEVKLKTELYCVILSLPTEIEICHSAMNDVIEIAYSI